jgi:TRAP-type mannitol/chloroaromatic compound transport system permease small subunit
MKILLTVSRVIDALNATIGRALIWLVLIMVLVSAGNAVSRYLLNQSSNAWLELQWYLFSVVFLVSAGYTLLADEHIRIDVISSHLSRRAQIWIDIFGTMFFLLPMSILIMWLSWPVFVNAWVSGEISSNAGGLIRWPARLLVPLGFLLLSLQGLSELIKRIAWLRRLVPDPGEKQAHPVMRQRSGDEGSAS